MATVKHLAERLQDLVERSAEVAVKSACDRAYDRASAVYTAEILSVVGEPGRAIVMECFGKFEDELRQRLKALAVEQRTNRALKHLEGSI